MELFKWLFRPPAQAATRPPHPLNAENRPVREPRPCVVWRQDSFPCEVVGESHYQTALAAICGRQSVDGHDLKTVATLAREPSNAFDRNAVMVSVGGRQVGYLPREQAERVGRQLIEAGLPFVECMARIQGGWRRDDDDEGHFGIRLAMPTYGWIDFGIGAEPPEGHSRPSARPVPVRNGPMSKEWVVVLGQPSDGPIAHVLASKGAHIMAGIGKSTSILVVHGKRPFDPGILRSATYKRAEVAGPSLRIMTMDEVRSEFW